jgi:hypothetical protein
MIGKVESSLPNSLGDVELRQHDPEKAKLKKSGAEASEAGDKDDAKEREDSVSNVPVNIRYLGKNLDLVA